MKALSLGATTNGPTPVVQNVNMNSSLFYHFNGVLVVGDETCCKEKTMLYGFIPCFFR
jgi:FMN phosphatase YigB (HAD superfamily)